MKKKVKPPLMITQLHQAKLKYTVRKTGKSYYRSYNYAKHIISRYIGEPKENAIHEYYLREGRGWKRVSEETFKATMSKEAMKMLHEKLGEDLKRRIEQIMSQQ